jgi:hypothetical protein
MVDCCVFLWTIQFLLVDCGLWLHGNVNNPCEHWRKQLLSFFCIIGGYLDLAGILAKNALVDAFRMQKSVESSHHLFEEKKRKKTMALPAQLWNSWRIPGSELLQGIAWYVGYKQRYQQIVYLRSEDGSRLLRNRWYYIWPHCLRPGGCKCACYPKNVESYYKNSEWENEDWSTSDEEGAITADSHKKNCMFFAYAKRWSYLILGLCLWTSRQNMILMSLGEFLSAKT